jgi:hypothetical protein
LTASASARLSRRRRAASKPASALQGRPRPEGDGDRAGFGILLDATIVRALLVPSLVSLFGSWNWYLPDGLARILRVRPSHAVTEKPVPEPATHHARGRAGTNLGGILCLGL